MSFFILEEIGLTHQGYSLGVDYEKLVDHIIKILQKATSESSSNLEYKLKFDTKDKSDDVKEIDKTSLKKYLKDRNRKVEFKPMCFLEAIQPPPT
eukprot:snap_masked-scaffold_71-processed-gene-0.39-mRNA-1 protein AED:1.00 eAED:1.00 QI:0/-1/0/0/-1/1/1/0/94